MSPPLYFDAHIIPLYIRSPLPSPPSATDAAFDRVDIAWFSMDPSRVLPLPAIAPYAEIQRFHDGLGSSFSMAASASASSSSSSSSSSSANDIVSDADLVAAINGSFWSRQAIAADGAYLAKVVAAYRRAAAVCGVRVEALLRGDDAGTLRSDGEEGGNHCTFNSNH